MADLNNNEELNIGVLDNVKGGVPPIEVGNITKDFMNSVATDKTSPLDVHVKPINQPQFNYIMDDNGYKREGINQLQTDARQNPSNGELNMDVLNKVGGGIPQPMVGEYASDAQNAYDRQQQLETLKKMKGQLTQGYMGDAMHSSVSPLDPDELSQEQLDGVQAGHTRKF